MPGSTDSWSPALTADRWSTRGLAAGSPDPAGAPDPGQVAQAVARRHPGVAGPDEVEIRETHISWVFLAGDRAYKLKKPLVLDFLDYGTPARRRRMCAEEVRLNAQLAPDIYVGVRAVTPAGDGLAITDDDDPAAIDYLVEMRRYDDDATLVAALNRGGEAPAVLGALGRTLAGFHQHRPPRPGDRGAVRVLAEVERNVWESVRGLTSARDAGRIERVGRFLRAFAVANATILDDRAAAGRVREVHGDLRAEHVILRPRLGVVDCLEFDPDLRTIDVADDLGFLVMDLTAYGATRAAGDLIRAYRLAGGDCGDDELVWFYAVHRALVRAKVARVRSGQQPAEAGSRTHADALVALAERLTWRGRGALCLVLCGVPASGKSHLANALAGAGELPVISSDVVRKELAGLAAEDRGPEQLYTTAASARTYGELAHRAARRLTHRSPVILDATFRRSADRDHLRRRLGPGTAVVFVECVAPAAVLAERARRRADEPVRVSDATAEVAQRLRAEWEPLDEIPAGSHLVLRTDRDTGSAVADVAAFLDERLAAAARR